MHGGKPTNFFSALSIYRVDYRQYRSMNVRMWIATNCQRIVIPASNATMGYVGLTGAYPTLGKGLS